MTLDSLEDIARYTAGELLDAITMNATSAEDVPRVIDELIAFMRDELTTIDWHEYDGQFGPEATQRQQEKLIKDMLERDNEPTDEPPPIDWGKRGPPPRRRTLLNDDENDA